MGGARCRGRGLRPRGDGVGRGRRCREHGWAQSLSPQVRAGYRLCVHHLPGAPQLPGQALHPTPPPSAVGGLTKVRRSAWGDVLSGCHGPGLGVRTTCSLAQGVCPEALGGGVRGREPVADPGQSPGLGARKALMKPCGQATSPDSRTPGSRPGLKAERSRAHCSPIQGARASPGALWGAGGTGQENEAACDPRPPAPLEGSRPLLPPPGSAPPTPSPESGPVKLPVPCPSLLDTAVRKAGREAPAR